MLLIEPLCEQEKWVREWVDKRTGFTATFHLKFYPARYDDQGFFSIFPVGETLSGIGMEQHRQEVSERVVTEKISN